jgi:hypothetical protein
MTRDYMKRRSRNMNIAKTGANLRMCVVITTQVPQHKDERDRSRDNARVRSSIGLWTSGKSSLAVSIWQQRLSLVLARGQASLVLGAVAAARNNAAGASGRKASPEFSKTDCQPSVSL